MYPALNLPTYNTKLKGDQIWCDLRKKYLKCTPEEWVRQHFIHFLIDSKNYPMGLMVSEHALDYNGMKKRADIAVYNRNTTVDVIVECKAPHISITEDTFYQAAKYTRVLGAKMIMLTNGIDHYCALLDQEKGELKYLKEIPNYEDFLKC